MARAVDTPSLLGDRPLTLVTNFTSVLPDLTRGVDRLLAAGARVSALITPEHGFWGSAQAGESEPEDRYGSSSLPVFDAYLCAGDALDTLIRRAVPAGGALVVDLQDIGTRFFTYTWTLFDLLCSAARLGVPVVVLDRPNPLGDRSHGPGLTASCASFVGRVSVPLQHGLTIGELARLFAEVHVPRLTGRSLDLEVIGLTGWAGADTFDRTELPWVPPSPNMPTLDTAVLYPATCLLEGTLLSEGRGTTRPFEVVGAGWLDQRFAAALRERCLPGIGVRELVFRPTFGKGAGQALRGVQLHLTDRCAFDPVLTGVTLLQVVADLHPDRPLWLQPEKVGRPFIDLLWGSAALREGIDEGAAIESISASSPAPEPYPDAIKLYS
nr:DUF1343 domain-containing protein [Microlunatus panaciterrae]